MRLKFLSLILILTVAMLAACNANDTKVASNVPNPASSPQTAYPDGARRITIAELDELMKNGQAFVVDVRNQASYDIGHIPGSKLIPAGEILNHVNELPRDKMIVTYCS